MSKYFWFLCFYSYKNKLKMKIIKSHKSLNLKGEIIVPGDKSISHRSLILSSCAIGESTISNLLESEDVFATMNALKH